MTQQQQNFQYGQLVSGHNYVTASIVDNQVKSLLLEYSLKSILVGQPLIDFIANGFKTNEQLRDDIESYNSRRNLQYAVYGLWLTVLLGIGEIYLATQEVKYGKLQVEQEQNVKLNEKQIKLIEEKADSIINLLKGTSSKLIEQKLKPKANTEQPSSQH